MATTDTLENEETKFEAPSKKLVGRGFSRRNQERIEQEEKELEELLKEETNETNEAGEDEEENREGPETKEAEPKSREEKSFKKRYGDLRRHMDSTVAQLKGEIESLKASDSTGKAPVSAEEIEKWVRENPKVARIVETIADQKANAKFESTNTRLSAIDQERKELDQRKAEETIRKSHKDFDTLKESDEFHDWVESQPQWAQDALYENEDDPSSVIRVIDLYKMDLKGRSRSRDAAKDSGARGTTSAPEGKPSTVYSESKVHKMSPADYEKHEQAILTSMSEGTFIYDMSSAR